MLRSTMGSLVEFYSTLISNGGIFKLVCDNIDQPSFLRSATYRLANDEQPNANIDAHSLLPLLCENCRSALDERPKTIRFAPLDDCLQLYACGRVNMDVLSGNFDKSSRKYS